MHREREPLDNRRTGAAKRVLGIFLAVIPALLWAACLFSGDRARPEEASIQRYGFEIVEAFPHDPKAYTQGLLWWGGRLYESTGQYGESSLRQVELETGRVLRRIELEERYFGEGLARLGNRLYQLTWESGRGFVYDRETFTLLSGFGYRGEGWGLAALGPDLVMSDGTSVLTVRDPVTFAEKRRIAVVDDIGPVWMLNELETVEGDLYANVYQTDRVVIIDPATGRVKAEIDFTGLLPPRDRHPEIDVLNGIAWDPEGRRLFVTGKYWPKLFHVRLVPRGGRPSPRPSPPD